MVRESVAGSRDVLYFATIAAGLLGSAAALFVVDAFATDRSLGTSLTIVVVAVGVVVGIAALIDRAPRPRQAEDLTVHETG